MIRSKRESTLKAHPFRGGLAYTEALAVPTTEVATARIGTD